ncbi:unnamed protein product [Hermetia illucens]|uniref:NADH dehydrogenase [ubiquinone] 1 alpha subcomplex subunit 7 n=1 Tax=Hermetia illucens TaxID=343691 RepID=A0A7R8UFR2_HERIL|nr:unnamed protein product [Hermetia illucens]
MPHRDISPFLQRFRNFLAGRELIKRHRFEDTVSPRTQPDPNLPGGLASTKLSNNHYYKRDPRSEVAPTTEIPLPGSQQMDSGEQPQEKQQLDGSVERSACQIEGKANGSDGARAKLPLPGRIYRWD